MLISTIFCCFSLLTVSKLTSFVNKFFFSISVLVLSHGIFISSSVFSDSKYLIRKFVLHPYAVYSFFSEQELNKIFDSLSFSS